MSIWAWRWWQQQRLPPTGYGKNSWAGTTPWRRCQGAPTHARDVGHHATTKTTPSTSCLHHDTIVSGSTAMGTAMTMAGIVCNSGCARSAPCSRVPSLWLQHRSMMMMVNAIRLVWTIRIKAKRKVPSPKAAVLFPPPLRSMPWCRQIVVSYRRYPHRCVRCHAPCCSAVHSVAPAAAIPCHCITWAMAATSTTSQWGCELSLEALLAAAAAPTL